MKCYVEAAPQQCKVAPKADTLVLLHAGATVAMTLRRVLDFFPACVCVLHLVTETHCVNKSGSYRPRGTHHVRSLHYISDGLSETPPDPIRPVESQLKFWRPKGQGKGMLETRKTNGP